MEVAGGYLGLPHRSADTWPAVGPMYFVQLQANPLHIGAIYP